MNAGDLVVLSALGLFAIFGLLLGFVGVVLLAARWVGAAMVTMWGFAPAQKLARQLIDSPLIADVVAGVVLFVISLVILSIVSHAIGNLVRRSSLNALDRTLGFMIGTVGGIAVVALSYLAFTQWIWATPTDRPEWVRQARTLPLVEATADFLRGLAPPEYRSKTRAAEDEISRRAQQAQDAQRVLRALNSPATNTPATEAETGYKTDVRRDLERLIQNAQPPEGQQKR
ncbi:MAG TPA: CvpA family protein [Alphaproteobacteria bacterium]|nr:CvpA family protein [Alphaproteobacteria bacterium]